jgi:FkbM family methyltransferase
MGQLRIFAAFRSIVWRIGRKFYRWARREVSKGPEKNGEYWLLEQVLKAAPGATPCLLDIGARMGDWSECAQALLKRAGLKGRVHAIEPSTASYAYLTNRLKSSESVHTYKLALSDQSGIRDFFVLGDLDGINSLVPVDGALVEQVATMRLDDYLDQQLIDSVLMVKSDAEGHDLNILQGASELFRHGRVEVWQFEYNHRWLSGRAQLSDVFDFIADKPYRLGKLHASGIEIYERWHPELERYFEANYVLVRQGSAFESLCSPVRFNRKNILEPAVS